MLVGAYHAVAHVRCAGQVHFNSPMNPLEQEMYHQIKNVIGVNPIFYEYLFMIDADTTMDPFSLNPVTVVHSRSSSFAAWFTCSVSVVRQCFQSQVVHRHDGAGLEVLHLAPHGQGL